MNTGIRRLAEFQRECCTSRFLACRQSESLHWLVMLAGTIIRVQRPWTMKIRFKALHRSYTGRVQSSFDTPTGRRKGSFVNCILLRCFLEDLATAYVVTASSHLT